MAMSAEHKAALAQGRRESRAIKAYLSALGSRKPGRPVTADSVGQKLKNIEAKLGATSDPMRRLELVQARIDAEDSLKNVVSASNIGELEKDFVSYAKGYSERKGISYSAWRQIGVPADVLKKAGIPRTRRS